MSDWRTVLGPTPDCIDVARFGEELTDAERAHVDACVRCRTELALFGEMMGEESSPESQWIAAELQRRNRRNNVVAFRPKRMLYAVAAALVVLIGVSAWMQYRERPIDIDTAPGTYRSARLGNLTPAGELAQAPNELRWDAVPGATHYRVQIAEVDAQPVWGASTTEPRAVLPPHVVAQFAPGKSLLWSVEAFRGNESLTQSQTETIRVTP